MIVCYNAKQFHLGSYLRCYRKRLTELFLPYFLRKYANPANPVGLSNKL